MITPKFVPIISVTGVVSLVLCAALAWQVRDSADAETQSDCERSIAARDDSRSMWLYLLGQANPDQTAEEQARFDAFTVELDKRLPALKCEDGDPVPDRSR